MLKNGKFNKYFLIPSIGEVIFLTIFLCLSFDLHSRLLADGDTAWHIRVGEYILDTHSVPTEDIYSHRSPPIPFTAHEWLSELVMATVYRFSGLSGLVVFFAFIIASIYYFVFKIEQRKNYNILVVVGVSVLIIAPSIIHWLARPHIFSLLFFLIYYHVLNQYQFEDRNRMLLLIPLMLLWINMHGGFLVGFLLLGTFLAGNMIQTFTHKKTERYLFKEKTRTIAFTIIGCLCASLINPYGYHLLIFPLKFFSQTLMIHNVNEFLSPNFHNLPIKLFEFVMLTAILVICLSKDRMKIIEVLLLVGFLHMALYSVRYILLFVIIVTPVLTRQIQILLSGSSSKLSTYVKNKGAGISEIDKKSSGSVWILSIVIAVSILTVSGKISHSFNDNKKPLAAIEFLMKNKIPGNMMNSDEFGDLLIYKAYPEYKVFIDGRMDMYGEKKLKEYSDIIFFNTGWEKIIEKYNVNWMIIPTKSGHSRYLLVNDYWKLIYSDKVANIFIRNTENNQPLIMKYQHVIPYESEEKSP